MRACVTFFLVLFLAVPFSPVLGQQQRQDSLRVVLADRALPDTVRMKAMDRLAWSFMYTDPDSARKWAQRHLEMARRSGARRQEGNALNTLGTVSWIQSDFQDALVQYEASLAIREETKDLRGISASLGNIGLIHKQLSDYPRALEYQLKGLAIEQQRGDRHGEARSLSNIGNIHISLGDYDRALTYHRQALAIDEQIGDSASLGRTLGNVGLSLYRMGRLEEALDHQQRSLSIRRAINDRRGMAIALYNVAKVLEDRGDEGAALFHHVEAMELERELRNRQGEAQSLVAIAELHLRMGRSSQAREQAGRALSIAREIGDRETQNSAHELLYRVYRSAGRMGDALHHHERFVELRDSISGEEDRQEITRQEMRFEYEKRMLADSLSFAAGQREKDLRIAEQQANIRLQRIGIGASVLGLLLIAALAMSIRRGKKRSDALLLNILPAETAEELKARGRAEARLFQEVTVLFTDFKGFTELSETLPPQELVALIDECFRAFDGIVEHNGVEKIKTIGDAYMAVGGLPSTNATHARDVVRAAIAIRDWMQAFRERRAGKGLPAPDIRIGVHTGPVVAGIVGVKKFQYDIWGDTVNTASRMESHGEVGQVNISASTRARLGGRFASRSRGMLPVKGKGELEMFIVDRELS